MPRVTPSKHPEFSGGLYRAQYGRLCHGACSTELNRISGALPSRAKPGNELFDGVFVASTGMYRRQRIEYGRLRLV
jgi:hypothetical protein